MKMIARLVMYCCCVAGSLVAAGSPWVENPSDPIYNPFAVMPEDYFPYVIYDQNQFNGDGDAVFYKMWHQGPTGIALSYSNDGINWVVKSPAVISGNAFHACVLYDQGRFGGGLFAYKMWFWNGVAGTTPAVIQFAFSTDGITWTAPLPITQDISNPIAVGIAGQYFYHLYGPGFVRYNPAATSQPGQPYTFPYVMFFDTATEGFGPGTSVEQIGLAYSTDGIMWSRFGTDPVFIPSGNAADWDGSHAFRPSLQIIEGTYNLFYSGSNEKIPIGIQYAHGLGRAISPDGITWTRDPTNPIFISSDGVAWRNTRSYTPFVLFATFTDTVQTGVCQGKMWFTGGTGDTPGENEGIGYATAPCPFIPPKPPKKFCGKVHRMEDPWKHKFFILHAHWKKSPSSDVMFYRIYEKKKVVKQISATRKFRFKHHLHSRDAWKKFSITAVDFDGLESAHRKLRLCS